MGYHTDFDGALEIKPPLTADQVATLEKWSVGDDIPEYVPRVLPLGRKPGWRLHPVGRARKAV